MYYFEKVENRKELERILERWLDTPFRHHCGVKDLGCDCVHFTACVFEELGVLKSCKNLIPDYPRDWHLHNTRELLAEGIERELNVEKVGLTNLMDGDIVLSHYGKAASHSAIYFERLLYQALDRIGVCKINFSDRFFRKQMRFAYRLLK